MKSRFGVQKPRLIRIFSKWPALKMFNVEYFQNGWFYKKKSILNMEHEDIINFALGQWITQLVVDKYILETEYHI